MSPEQLIQIIAMGEGYQAEFKRSVPSKPREIAEEVCAFANAAGGLVIIGVEDDNTVVGVVVDNRVEISNPGGLVSAISDEEFGRKSFSRNPLVFGLFNRMRMVEQIGSGIPRVREMMHEAGLPEPEFRYDGMFTVIAKRPVEWSTKRMTLTHVLSENQIKIMDLIYHNSSISKLTLSKELGISTTAIDKNIGKLRKLGLLKRIGSAFKGKWIIQ